MRRTIPEAQEHLVWTGAWSINLAQLRHLVGCTLSVLNDGSHLCHREFQRSMLTAQRRANRRRQTAFAGVPFSDRLESYSFGIGRWQLDFCRQTTFQPPTSPPLFSDAVPAGIYSLNGGGVTCLTAWRVHRFARSPRCFQGNCGHLAHVLQSAPIRVRTSRHNPQGIDHLALFESRRLAQPIVSLV